MIGGELIPIFIENYQFMDYDEIKGGIPKPKKKHKRKKKVRVKVRRKENKK
jgi:hypothetical protein